MWIGVLWAGLRVAMLIIHVGDKFRHGLLEKPLIFAGFSWFFGRPPGLGHPPARETPRVWRTPPLGKPPAWPCLKHQRSPLRRDIFQRFASFWWEGTKGRGLTVHISELSKAQLGVSRSQRLVLRNIYCFLSLSFIYLAGLALKTS